MQIVPDFAALAQPGIRGLRAYDPGHDLVALRRRFADAGLVELGSNENPYGPSPRVREALSCALDEVYRYPDPLGGELKAALAQRLGVTAQQLILGNGSHELLMQIAQAFAGPDAEVLVSQYCFAVYPIAAQAAGAPLRVVPALPPDAPMSRGHDADALAAAIGARTRLLYLANPNNPTGTWLDGAALRGLLAAAPPDTLVVIDEAYAEYADDDGPPSALALLDAHPNLLISRTFSKAHGLAGLRIGYAVGHPALIAVLERLRESFNVNCAGLAAARAALDDPEHVRSVRLRNAAERARLDEALRTRGWQVAPSQTNFVLAQPPESATSVEAALLDRGVVLRPMAGYGLPQCLRVSVGTSAENDRLIAALDA